LHDGSVDLRRHVLLEADPPDNDLPEPASIAEGPGTATVAQYRSSHVEVRTHADGLRMLVLTDLYYPGWQAFVDGRPAPMYRANYAFRGVPVPGGDHVVQFEFRPLSFLIGATISGATLLGLIGWWGVSAWLQSRKPKTSSRYEQSRESI